MFDPNEYAKQCEKYLSRYLGCQVEFIKAAQLTQSSREAPWRLDVRADGALQSYVLQLDPDHIEIEYGVLKAMELVPIPTPRVYGLDLDGTALGVPCFFSDFIEGESLLAPMLAGEAWAEDLYIDSVFQLQAVSEAQLGEVAKRLKRESAGDVLEEAYAYLKDKALPVVDRAYQVLKASLPEDLPVRFSNGDLWLDNFIVAGKKLAGIIDFPNATFSDPIYEFLLSFFVSPELRGRGIEARYCRRLGFDPSILHWYHGLEYFDTLRWVMLTGDDFVQHSEQSLLKNLQSWLGDESWRDE